MANMYKMNMAPVASAVALQLQEGVFPLEGEQKGKSDDGVRKSDPLCLCFPLLCFSHASFEYCASTDGFIILPLLLNVESSPLSSFLPRGIRMHGPDVDHGTENPVDNCLVGNVEEYTSVSERE